MAVIKYPQEIKVGVSPKRMFKAMVTESYTILPKIMPVAIKSIELLHGDGGAGTIRQTNFPDGQYRTLLRKQFFTRYCNK
ncbi:UNVERIFIED_CONTAM: putative intracellular pathogenesis-related protein T1 [Sesamum indicum]